LGERRYITYLEERNMGENDLQEHASHFQPPLVRSNAPEEMSEPEEEPDQRWRKRQKERLLRDEKIKLIIICIGLLALLLSFLLFLYTGNFLPLFGAIVIAYPSCRWLDADLDTSETSQQRRGEE
jgi:hypothetical protein